VMEDVSPGDLTCDALLRATQALLDANGGGRDGPRVDLFAIADFVLAMYLQGLLEIGAAPPRFRTTVPEFPLASPLARLQAEQGMVVTNLRHQRVQLGALNHELLRNLDGHRDRRELGTLLNDAVASDRLTITSETGQLPAAELTRKMIDEILEQGLASLTRLALLMQ